MVDVGPEIAHPQRMPSQEKPVASGDVTGPLAEPHGTDVTVTDGTDVSDVRPSGSADEVRNEIIPTVSLANVRSVTLTLLAVIGATWALYVMQSLLVPLLLGVIISLVLAPLVDGLRRLGLPRAAGAAVVLGMMVTVLADDLPRVARRVRQMLVRSTQGEQGAMANLQQAAQELTQAAEAEATPARAASERAQPVRVVEPPARLRDYVTTGTGIAAQVLMVFFLVFFLLSAGDLYKRKFVKLTGPSLSRKKITVQIIDEINEQIGVYLRTLVVVSSIVGIATWLAYTAVGMPNAAVWGLLAGVANVVPYVGPTLVAGLASAMAFAHFGTIGSALTVGGIQVVITSLEGFLLTPMLMSRSARMNPVAMFIGLLFWGWLWGTWGVVLGVPLLMAIKVIADRIDDFHAVGELLGD
jgi:predicted PurR-regulated permease PerM